MLDPKVFQEANERRDRSLMALFTKVLNRMIEAHSDLLRYADERQQPAIERYNKFRKALLETMERQLEGTRNIEAKYMELSQLVPQPLVIGPCPNCGHSVLAEKLEVRLLARYSYSGEMERSDAASAARKDCEARKANGEHVQWRHATGGEAAYLVERLG